MGTDGGALACGVVGAGVFGGFHAAKYAAHDRARLVGIYDPTPERAAELAARFPGARGFGALENLLAECDAVTLASPAVHHAEQGLAALAAGCHVLVEKPLAGDAQSALALVEAAEAAGLQLHAGHQERFVARAAGLMDAPAPRAFGARRLNPAGPRGLDVSVVMDLMIHDLDLALRLIGSPPAEIVAEGNADEMEARVRFRNGAEGAFAASRVAPAQDRATRIVWADGAAEIDWSAKTLDNRSPYRLNPDFAADPQAKDSLGANVAAFIASVLDGAPAMAPGREAAAAAALAEAIEWRAGLR